MTHLEKINNAFYKSIDSIHEIQALIGPCSPMDTYLYNALISLLTANEVLYKIRMKSSLEETARLTDEIKISLSGLKEKGA